MPNTSRAGASARLALWALACFCGAALHADDTTTGPAPAADATTASPAAEAMAPAAADASTPATAAVTSTPAADASTPPAATASPAPQPAAAATPASTSDDADTAKADANGADATAGDGDAPTSNATVQRAISTEERVWLDTIGHVEASGGAFDPSLPQQLLGLGRTYQNAGMHEEAIKVLGRAAHITRVNQGLYSAANIPILEMLIESYAALGKWGEVGDRYERMFDEERKLYGDHDLRLLAPLKKLSSWHMRAYLDNLDNESENGPLNHLLAARALYDASIAILQQNYGPNGTQLIDTLRESSIVSYYLARTIPRPTESGMSFSTAAVGEEQREDAMAGAPLIYSYRGYNTGLEALRQVEAIHRADPASTPEQRAAALAEIADWNLLFGHPQNAMALYRDAYNSITQAGLPPERAAALFASPVLLPVAQQLAAFSSQPTSPDPAATATLVATFDVGEQGRPRNITVAPTTPPAPRSEVIRLQKMVRGMLFRPRLSNGESVVHTGLSYTYVYKP